MPRASSRSPWPRSSWKASDVDVSVCLIDMILRFGVGLEFVAMRWAWPSLVFWSLRVRERTRSHASLGALVRGSRPGRRRPRCFGGLAGVFAFFAKILLFVFVILFVLSLIFGRGRGLAL